MRPLRPNEVLDTALGLYQRVGLSFLRMAALPCVFCVASVAFLTQYLLPDLLTTAHPESTTAQASEMITTVGIALVLGLPVFLFGLAYGAAQVVRMTADRFEGIDSNERRAARDARARFPAMLRLMARVSVVSLSGILISASLMALGAVLTQSLGSNDPTPGVLVLVGGCGLAVGGLLFVAMIVRDSLAPVVLIVEGCSVSDAIRRGRILARQAPPHGTAHGVILNLYGLLLLLFLAILTTGEALGSLLAVSDRIENVLRGSVLLPLSKMIVTLGVPYVALWTLLPFWACTLTVCYFERRIRLEGFDIDRLAGAIRSDDT